jgi:small subunit ribosomal protein S18
VGRNNDRDRGKRTPTKDSRPDRGKKKVCIFCTGQVTVVDYKDINTLRRFISDRGKIRARRTTGTCTQHQADVAVAIKTARELALLPYLQRTATERVPGRGGRDRGDRGPRAAVVDDVVTANRDDAASGGEPEAASTADEAVLQSVGAVR